MAIEGKSIPELDAVNATVGANSFIPLFNAETGKDERITLEALLDLLLTKSTGSLSKKTQPIYADSSLSPKDAQAIQQNLLQLTQTQFNTLGSRLSDFTKIVVPDEPYQYDSVPSGIGIISTNAEDNHGLIHFQYGAGFGMMTLIGTQNWVEANDNSTSIRVNSSSHASLYHKVDNNIFENPKQITSIAASEFSSMVMLSMNSEVAPDAIGSTDLGGQAQAASICLGSILFKSFQQDDVNYSPSGSMAPIVVNGSICNFRLAAQPATLNDISFSSGFIVNNGSSFSGHFDINDGTFATGVNPVIQVERGSCASVYLENYGTVYVSTGCLAFGYAKNGGSIGPNGNGGCLFGGFAEGSGSITCGNLGAISVGYAGTGETVESTAEGCAVFGRNNRTTKPYALVSGRNAEAKFNGERALGGVLNNTYKGKIQSGEFMVSGVTTDNTPDSLADAIDNSSLDLGGVGYYDLMVEVVGMSADGDTFYAAKKRLSYSSDGGSLTQRGSTQTIGTDINVGAVTGVSFSPDATNLEIRVTGKSSETITWTGKVSYVYTTP